MTRSAKPVGASNWLAGAVMIAGSVLLITSKSTLERVVGVISFNSARAC